MTITAIKCVLHANIHVILVQTEANALVANQPQTIELLTLTTCVSVLIVFMMMVNKANCVCHASIHA
jgi:lipoprotein signal peptidase